MKTIIKLPKLSLTNMGCKSLKIYNFLTNFVRKFIKFLGPYFSTIPTNSARKPVGLVPLMYYFSIDIDIDIGMGIFGNIKLLPV